MKFASYGLLVLALSASAILAIAAEEQRKSKLPPLKIDMSSPLLLDDAQEKPDKKVHKADNQACYVCHANYQEEELVGWHAEEDVGCVDCHGNSFAHRNDENNTTPPDVMFPRRKIDANCRDCHEEHDVPAHKVIARFLERELKKTAPKSLVCTDCHGQHRLKLRTVVWNKETGELITGKEQAKAEGGKGRAEE